MRSAVLKHARSNIVAYLALFVALGGTSAYAANSVFSTDIVDGQVKTPDLAVNAVTSGRILDNTVQWQDLAVDSVTSSRVKDGTIGGYDMVPDTVTGNEVRESSLGTVPKAQDANTLGGLAPYYFVQGRGSLRDWYATIPLGSSGGVVGVGGQVSVSLTCAQPHSMYHMLNSSTDGYTVYAFTASGSPVVVPSPPNNTVAHDFAVDNSGDMVTFHLVNAAHRGTIMAFSRLRHDDETGSDVCEVSGHALDTP
jgi:hypothetical protein